MPVPIFSHFQETLRRRQEGEDISEPVDDSVSKDWQQRLRLLNNCSTGYFFLVVMICYFISVFLTLPHFFATDSAAYWLRVALMSFFVGEVLLNYVVVRSTALRNFTSEAQLYALPQRSAPECVVCGVLQPHRAHHCPSCQRCILRRDHHCYFTNCCIGHWNQRHFFCFLIYVSLGCCFTLAFLVFYLQDVFNFPSPLQLGFGFAHYLMPIALLQWVFGYQTMGSFLPVICFDLTLAAGAFALSFTALQVILIARGQVTHEFFSGFSNYSRNYLANFRGVFGDRWFVQLLVPLPSLALPRDGVQW